MHGMYSYTIPQWLFFFYFYCFLGWCIESSFVSLTKRKLVNRGFMRGPFLPLYGSGAIMMLLMAKPFEDNLVLVFLAGCIGATILEYVTGVTMEALFKVRYWDYSKNKFNFQGHICLGTSLAWGGLTILMTEFLHKPVEKFVLSIPPKLLGLIVLVLTAYICADFALSFKAALDLKNVMFKLEKVKEELAHMQKRLDVLIALRNEEIADRKEEIAEELMELKLKYQSHQDYHVRLKNLRDFFQRDLIRANPSMSSKRFKDILEELKENLDKKKK